MSTKPKIIAFRPPEVKTYWEEQGVDDRDVTEHWPVEFLVCYNFSDLSKALLEKPILIMVAYKLIKQYTSLEEFMAMLETLIKISNIKPPAIGIGFCTKTTQEEIKEIKKTSAVGIFPSIMDFGVDELYFCLNDFLENKKVYPKHLIEQLPSQCKKNDRAVYIGLSIRQQQVYNLITERGLTNKQIAQILKLSENTVKLHVSKIMKIYQVANRTQLVAFKNLH